MSDLDAGCERGEAGGKRRAGLDFLLSTTYGHAWDRKITLGGERVL
jgi:hypothetical protein